jgi:hypothetical protein
VNKTMAGSLQFFAASMSGAFSVLAGFSFSIQKWPSFGCCIVVIVASIILYWLIDERRSA